MRCQRTNCYTGTCMYQRYEDSAAWRTATGRDPDAFTYGTWQRVLLCLATDSETEGFSYLHDKPLQWRHVFGQTFAATLPRSDMLESVHAAVPHSVCRPELIVRSVYNKDEATVIAVPADGIVRLPLLALQHFDVELQVQAKDDHDVPMVKVHLSEVQCASRMKLATLDSFDCSGKRYRLTNSSAVWGPGAWSKLTSEGHENGT